MNPVSILVSNYNSGDAIQLCVESIRRYTPEGDYHLIVYNDICKNGIDDKYLRECRDKGWLTLYENDGPVALGYKTVVNRLLHEICKTDKAVLMDCDIQILEHGWLADLMQPLDDPKVLAVCNERGEVINDRGWCTGFYQFWFAGLNMPAYRDGMQIDWDFSEGDRREWPFNQMFKQYDGVYFPIKNLPTFNDNRVLMDPGSQLWIKIRYYNPKGYKIVNIPLHLNRKYYHHGHISFFYDIPDDHDEYTRQNKRARINKMADDLRRFREGQ